jgi:predicted Zn-dependent protease
LGRLRATLASWRHEHPRLTAGALLVFTALVIAAGYKGGSYFLARAHFRKAHHALNRHAWSDARDHLQAYLRRRPDDPTAQLLAARAARRLELLDEADEHLTACQRLQAGSSQALEVESALLRVHRGDLAGAETFLCACIEQNDPATVEILDILSAALILNYRVKDAQRCLDSLLQRQPDHFDALVRRSWTAQSLSRYPDGVIYLEKALSLRPDADNVRLSLAEIQVAIGRLADAQAHFEALRERQPNNPSVLFGLARCLAGRGHKKPAAQLLDRLLADHPNDWKALEERGWLEVELEHAAEGEAYLRRAEALAPPDLPLLVRLSECLRLLGKEEESRAYQEKAKRLKADFERASYLGDQIRERSPNDPALRHELACLLLRLGKPQDALHWFQTALDKDPLYRPTHEALAAFYDKSGLFEQAAHHRRLLQGAASVNSGGSAQ